MELNSRLDEIQAAILRVKLRHLDAANEARRERAHRYQNGLQNVLTPSERAWGAHVYHLYVVEVDDRDELRAMLAEQGVATEIHYPIPVHLQSPFADAGSGRGDLPVTERQANRVLSLPMYP